MLKDRDNSLKITTRTKKPEDIIVAKAYKNLANKMVRKTRNDYIVEHLEQNRNDPNKFWEAINKLLPGNANKSNFHLEYDAGKEIKSEEVADYINNFFASVGKKKAGRLPKPTGPPITMTPRGQDDVTFMF